MAGIKIVSQQNVFFTHTELQLVWDMLETGLM
jgi:hypothetical protein